MKTNTWLTLSVVAVGALFATSAHAGWSVGVSIGVPVYYPAPLVVTAPPPCPPPVVVVPPPRVVYAPPVVCYPPRPAFPPVVYAPRGYAWGVYHNDRDRWDARRGGDHDGRYDRDRNGDRGGDRDHRDGGHR